MTWKGTFLSEPAKDAQQGLSLALSVDPQQSLAMVVEGLYSQGIMTYCLALSPNADSYVKRIFAINNCTVIDDMEKLPVLFATITK